MTSSDPPTGDTGRPEWGVPPNDPRIRAHLDRQRGVPAGLFVRLDDGRVVRVGQDAEGEGGG